MLGLAAARNYANQATGVRVPTGQSLSETQVSRASQRQDLRLVSALYNVPPHARHSRSAVDPCKHIRIFKQTLEAPSEKLQVYILHAYHNRSAAALCCIDKIFRRIFRIAQASVLLFLQHKLQRELSSQIHCRGFQMKHCGCLQKPVQDRL